MVGLEGEEMAYLEDCLGARDDFIRNVQLTVRHWQSWFHSIDIFALVRHLSPSYPRIRKPNFIPIPIPKTTWSTLSSQLASQQVFEKKQSLCRIKNFL